jgi:hypothetical protein
MEIEFLPSFASGFKAAYLGTIYDWAKEHVTLPVDYNPPGRFDVSTSKFLVGVLDSLRNPKVTQTNVMASPRSGKTLAAELFLLFTVPNNPGPFLWIQSSDEQMDKMGDLRMGKLIRSCPPVRDLIDGERFAVTKQRFKFANGMTVQLGAAKIRDLQSVGYKYIVGDEVWLWDKGQESGLIAEAQARTGDFPDTSKILLISQGGINGDEWTTEFNRGVLHEWGWLCPYCNKEQVLLWNIRRPDGTYGGIIWDRNSKTFKDEQWIYEAAAATAKLECVHCRNRIDDTPNNRAQLNNTGRYLCTDPNGDAKKESFRWNALANPRVPFSDLVKEYLFAVDQSDFTGDDKLKEIFTQKRLARSHGFDRVCETVNINLDTYDSNAEWKDEYRRFLTIDVQRKSPRFWFVCRAWAKNGSSRKIGHGHVETWEDVEALRIKYKVKENRVFVDAGDGSHAQEIYNECAKHGRWIKFNGEDHYICWIACHGTNQKEFKHRSQDGVWYPYGQEEFKAVQLGNDPKYKKIKGCPYIIWSSTRIKDSLWKLIQGKGPLWVSNEKCEEYIKHLSSEVRTRVRKGKHIDEIWEKVTRDARNEYWDCEAMECLAASVNKILSIDMPNVVKEAA